MVTLSKSVTRPRTLRSQMGYSSTDYLTVKLIN
ncbi:hypothetical protein V3C99_006586 [Haemonchus contortus]|uniref:Integrase n=1 Tax=Haemonchus contortus TaxID=6289 RepID=A0A7I4YRA0_HAECO